jgi:hypothetical protein
VIELERTFDPVRLSVLRAVLAEAEIENVVFDAGAGGLWQGAIPSRLMVRDDDLELAKRALAAAGIEPA